MWGDIRHCGPTQVLRSMFLSAACLLCSQCVVGAEAGFSYDSVSEFVHHPSSVWHADSVADSFPAPIVDGHPPKNSLTYDPSVREAQFAFQPAFRPPTTSAPTVGRVQSRNSIASNLASPSTVDEFWRLLVTSSVKFRIPGDGSKFRSAGDTVDLIGKTSIPGVNTSAKQPITTTAKVRGGREAQTQKSGSYWIPARMDLDSALSKIDSRLLQDVSIIKGPYSSLYGPGFSFIDSQLKPSPRFDGFQHQASTSLDYKSNGEQWHGRQTVLAGDEDSGFRVSYGHRTGSDYESGNGTSIPTSYHSRDLTFVYGTSLSPHSRIEFSALRLDQTDVELPGQAFDIDFLVTDAYEVEYTNETAVFADRFELSSWYNRTNLAGSAQREGKRRQFPVYDAIDFVGNTDVDSMSTGYTAGWTWEQESGMVVAGTDLRYIKQELNEITSGDTGLSFWRDRNSPIPRSHQTNPGLFAQQTRKLTEDIDLTSGARVDFVSARIDEEASALEDVAVRQPFENLLSFAEIVGSDNFDRDFTLGSVFFLVDTKLTQNWRSTLGYGYAERAPTLTELYAAESFMFLLQNGLNTVTGNPDLSKERLWQIDAGLTYESERLRSGLSGFHAWIRDYVTFENMDSFALGGITEQTNLKFVNTDLATLAGGEFYAEYDNTPWVTTFATLSYVEGRDHSRNGDFATQEPDFNATIPSVGSQQVAGQPRGSFSGVVGADEEPLPNIAPLDARVGLRLHESSPNPHWGLEVSARIVDNQDRVASSLLESETPGFTIIDVRGFMRPSPSLLMVAGVENLGDRQYREYLDFRPQNAGALTVFRPGVNFYFGTEFTY